MKTLIGKLNPLCKKALESAAALCVSKTHYSVELEHFILKLLESQESDVNFVLRYYEIDIQSIHKQLVGAIDRFKIGNTGSTVLSPHLLTTLENAWMTSSLQLGQETIRSGTILMSIIDVDALRGILLESCPLLLRISRNTYREDMVELMKHGPEHGQSEKVTTSEPVQNPSLLTRQEGQALKQFTVNLTEEAAQGKLDPIYGRDMEIRQLMDVLMRRRQNNPILVGDAGVGKTAIVEGLAQRIAQKQVPPALSEVSLHILDIGLLQAGASVKGEFEQRLSNILAEVKSADHPIILFIDEAHTLIGAGGQAGIGDAANLLKPALARGELRTIAATTWGEYKRYIEKDPALTRRFELIKVDEPSPENALQMLRSVANKLSVHHQVPILDEAIQAAISLSQRFLSGRKLPDKAVSVLDTACAQVALSQTTEPEPLETLNNSMHLLQVELDTLQEEISGRTDHSHRIKEITDQLVQMATQVTSLSMTWGESKHMIQDIQKTREELHELMRLNSQNAEIVSLQRKLRDLEDNLPRGIDQQSLIPICVDKMAISRVISGWTGIPNTVMLSFEEGLTSKKIFSSLKARIVGQDHALETISRHVVSYRAGLADPHKPMGVFFLVGPSGVGKTETAQVLAEVLTGSDQQLIRINMSEFQEAYSVSTLKGSPPGYVGYGRGGTLTEAVRRNPYSVVLLDEIEKAHPDVLEMFYQVFDKGKMEDSEGIEIDFRNTLIILTSNLASDEIVSLWENEHVISDSQMAIVRDVLLKHFRTAFLARLTVIPYHPLEKTDLLDIIRLKLTSISERLEHQHHAHLTYLQEDLDKIITQCADLREGARAIDHLLNQKLLPSLSEAILDRQTAGQEIGTLELGKIMVA